MQGPSKTSESWSRGVANSIAIGRTIRHFYGCYIQLRIAPQNPKTPNHLQSKFILKLNG